MVTTSLRIHRTGETFQFVLQHLVPRMLPMAPATEEAEVSERVLQMLIGKMKALDEREEPVSRTKMLELGRWIDTYILPEETRSALQEMNEAPVVIITGDARIPWELAGVNGDGDDATNLAERVPVGRSLAIAGATLEVDEGVEAIDEKTIPRALLVVDPLDALPDARREGRVLTDYLNQMGWEVEYLTTDDATHDALFEALQGGEYDFVHFCCDVVPHGTGGAVAAADDQLTASTVRRMDLTGCVAYINACSSALSQSGAGGQQGIEAPVAGLAQAFMEAGASGVIGSMWAASDRTSRFFAQSFYSKLAQGATLGESLLAARSLSTAKDTEKDLEGATLAGFVLYGDPQLQLSMPETRGAVETGAVADGVVDIGDEDTEGEAETVVATWPPAGWFAPDVEEALNVAAAAARATGSTLTSMHLARPLLADDTPLAEWMNRNEYPLKASQKLAEVLLKQDEGEEIAGIGGAAAVGRPALSPTLEGIMQWAEEAHEEGPVTLAQLTERYAAEGGGIMGKLLEMLMVPLEDYPEDRVRVPRSEEAEEAVASGENTAAMWNDGMMSSTHLLLGVFEAGGGRLAEHLRRAGRDPEAIRDTLADGIMDGSPDPNVTEIQRSLNVSRILLAAENAAREEGHEHVLLSHIVDAAARLEAGRFGAFLEEIGYRADDGEEMSATVSPEAAAGGEPTAAATVAGSGAGMQEEPVPGLALSSEAEQLLALAAFCMGAAGHAQVGTPHLVASGLRIHDRLRDAVVAEGADPDDVMWQILNWLGVPPGIDPFEQGRVERQPVASASLSEALARAQSKAGSGPITADQLLVATLTQATSKVAILLQRMGIEPYRLAAALDDPGTQPGH